MTMQRIRIEQPAAYTFSTRIAIRITDLNYGNHVGNDAFLSLVHEARMQFLQSLGFSELNLDGAGLIMADAAMEYKAELHYGDTVLIEVAAHGFSAIGFDLVYRMTMEREGVAKLAGLAKTGMICFDYQEKKPVNIPAGALARLSCNA